MIERNGSDIIYMEIFTHHVGSIDAPSRRIVFIRGTNTKQWEVPNIAGRNTKANNNNNNNNNDNLVPLFECLPTASSL
jgi:hypothetical protein